MRQLFVWELLGSQDPPLFPHVCGVIFWPHFNPCLVEASLQLKQIPTCHDLDQSEAWRKGWYRSTNRQSNTIFTTLVPSFLKTKSGTDRVLVVRQDSKLIPLSFIKRNEQFSFTLQLFRTPGGKGGKSVKSCQEILFSPYIS